jgi:hypothetical protein
MRLFDRILQGGRGNADPQSLDPALVDDIAAANPRYVLDRFASRACGDLIRDADELFDAASPLMRMPAETFWVEAFQEGSEANPGEATGRIGILVDCDPTGRRGWVRHFSETLDGGCRKLPAWTEFDFDRVLQLDNGHSFRLQHDTIAHVTEFLRHTRIHVDPAYLRGVGENRHAQVLRELGEAIWFDIPIVASFAALLASPGLVDMHPSDLARLNRARVRRGRPALLDHIEVRMVLGSSGGATSDGSSHGRSTPRLHYVRGHFVNRQGKSFWRSPHLRGDSTKAVVQKTVRVTAAR